MSRSPSPTAVAVPVAVPVERPWWHPDRHRDRRPLLAARARITAAVRAWFADQGFVEVETACLQVSPGNEAHLHAFETRLVGPDLATRSLYLHTSPEFAAKKLLAAGETRIFTLAPVFRNREAGALHHPEFRMLEWYRTGADYAQLMGDCTELLRLAAAVAGSNRLSHGGAAVDPRDPPERLSVADAFQRFAGIDLLATTTAQATDRDALAGAATAAGIRVAEDDTWADIFSRVLVERVEPAIGRRRVAFLDRYPVAAAALARRAADDPRVAERFEVYACGVELANAFGELTDADEQRRRLDREMDEKARIYGERYPIDEEFLAALAMMPDAAGCALGFDRLVMLATGAPRITDVIWTPMADAGI